MNCTIDASPQLSVGLARLVGTVLANQAAAAGGPEDATEVRAITDAMVRLLIGTPLRSDGRLTVVSLTAEAGLRRNKLTHKHTGLKDLFYALVKARTTDPNPLTEAERGSQPETAAGSGAVPGRTRRQTGAEPAAHPCCPCAGGREPPAEGGER
ncbi:hypothetical protein KUTG_09951 [Kutzneria sp. 744]|nr:hypothetical protein KUTG_09951 [Kutzneria sp. 744]